jgi:hypothetical protein
MKIGRKMCFISPCNFYFKHILPQYSECYMQVTLMMHTEINKGLHVKSCYLCPALTNWNWNLPTTCSKSPKHNLKNDLANSLGADMRSQT